MNSIDPWHGWVGSDGRFWDGLRLRVASKLGAVMILGLPVCGGAVGWYSVVSSLQV